MGLDGQDWSRLCGSGRGVRDVGCDWTESVFDGARRNLGTLCGPASVSENIPVAGTNHRRGERIYPYRSPIIVRTM
eukprot:1412265-Pyramimonas_sp.AAC.2